jgi:Xaa-Pro aminopeptidase
MTATAPDGGARLAALRGRLPALDAAAFLVTSVVNVRYLTDFSSSNAALLVDAERAVLLTDGRYRDAALAVPGVEAVEAERDLPGDLRARLPTLTPGPVAFESDHLSVTAHTVIAGSELDLKPTRKVVEALRAVKDDAELDAIRRASAIADEMYERLARERVVGRTEATVAWWVERTIRELGAEAVSFAPIVASGPNAARPHHHPGQRVIEAGETLIVDAGARLDGYCSDCTRTFATGTLPPQLEQAYAACLEAQQRALLAVRAGADCGEVDGLARGMLLENGYEVLHNLGHSVGLEIHEDPRLAKSSTEKLAARNVVTVEPGVYLPGLGGVRIEDLVVAGAGAPEVLTPVTKELVTLA